jgi:hypothetical protein
MHDVAFRLNTSQPIKANNVVVANGSSLQLTSANSGATFYREYQRTFINESVPGTGLVNRHDDYTYYSS